MKHLFDKLVVSTNNECTKDHGHILSVERVIEIIDNQDTIFTVNFEAKTLKPEAGKKMSGVVCMVYKDGIFININNKQKMLIPALKLKEYEFDNTSKSYVNGLKKIEVGNTVEAIVTASKFCNKNFSCVGSLA
jgi:DNA-directed RNA polymerase subunit E'/Rpb7